MPPLTVLVFLPPPLLAHLRLVLQAHHALRACEDWAAFEHAARESNWDAVVADPCSENIVRTDQLIALIEAYPSIPLTLYSCVSPGTLRSIAELARFGQGRTRSCSTVWMTSPAGSLICSIANRPTRSARPWYAVWHPASISSPRPSRARSSA